MQFTLWPACVKVHGFEQQVQAAAAAGFDSLAISPVMIKALRDMGWGDDRIRDYPRDHGICLSHYDGFSDWAPLRYSPDLADEAKAIFDVSTDECLAICDALELNAICAVGAFGAGECELEALQDSFGRFAERAGNAGVRVDLEFLPMWGIADLATAWEVVAPSLGPASGILLDTWHFMRGNPDLELLASLPDGAITAVQLADADAEIRGDSLFEDTLRFRKLPGDGAFPLEAIQQALSTQSQIASIGPEIYADAMDLLSAEEAARQCAEASRQQWQM